MKLNNYDIPIRYFRTKLASRLRVRPQWCQNRHNTTVWADSRQGSKHQPLYCVWQWLKWTRSDWRVVFQQPPLSGPTERFVTSRPSGQKLAAVSIWHEHSWSGKTYLIEVVWDIPPFGDQRVKKLPQQRDQAKTLGWNTWEFKIYG